MGMVFAARRTFVGIESFEQIISEDGYEPIHTADALHVGDVVVYTFDGDLSHVAIVVSRGLVLAGGGDPNHLLLSQWGADGEYLHGLRDVPYLYGRPTQFYTDRKQLR
jgi:hypothetical protein